MHPPLPAPDFDAATAYPEIGVLRAALAAGDWPAVRRLWDRLDWAGRSHLAVAVGAIARPAETAHLINVLRAALAADPGDPAAGPMLGSHLISAGWRVRGASRARYVSERQFREFHEHLRRAEAVLIEATARDPENVAAWQMRVTSARGLELGAEEAQRRYDRLARTDPHHLNAQTSLLQMLCPKWSRGPWDRVHTFARERMLAAPEGAHNAVLVVDGHLEHWLDLPGGEDGEYLMSQPVRDEIYAAAYRSVWHPAFRRTFGWVYVLNMFAGVFTMVGDHRAAAGLFAALGPLATESPWDYLGGNPGETFVTRRAAAIAGAGVPA
ncbi:hypothetical protein J2S43_006417 [Catenuloplanes nepalensis]|uniref:DUF4034 domain-containing protein n=1 Tax=Catenuloplanes nepalensis TaxID=587533 RepID=A0ABT9N2J7_9ACTN|nr:hypothetical protein [Catenuloplanes nepalensis]MDP9797905.1 hypothetical protein [Catenuloplanes nepalensis]